MAPYCPVPGTVSSGLCSPHIIQERVAVRAPPPDRDGVLPAVRIVDPDIRPEHMPAPGPGIPCNCPAVIGAGRACAHTIKSVWYRHDKPLGWCAVLWQGGRLFFRNPFFPGITPRTPPRGFSESPRYRGMTGRWQCFTVLHEGRTNNSMHHLRSIE